MLHARLRPTLLALAVLVAIAGTASHAVALEEETPRYLPEGAVDAESIIGPPPAADSPAHAESLAIVLWLQRVRTPEQVAFVERPLDLGRFVPTLGADLLDVNGAEMSAVFEDIIDQVRDDYDALKAVYDDPRPFVTYPDEVDTVGDARPVAAYPSGHAIRATVYADLLSEIFPEHGAALKDLADQVAYGRVLAGVHYTYDVLAGIELGMAYAAAVKEQPAFQDALELIRPSP